MAINVRGNCGQDRAQWQEAQDRVLLYLKKLGVPALLSLEVAHRALAMAAEEAPAAAGGARPTRLAMRALHGILAESPELLGRTPYCRYSILYRRWQPDDSPEPSREAPDPESGLRLAALPPINRGAMNIRKI